jgi:hypothetical protein
MSCCSVADETHVVAVVRVVGRQRPDHRPELTDDCIPVQPHCRPVTIMMHVTQFLRQILFGCGCEGLIFFVIRVRSFFSYSIPFSHLHNELLPPVMS